MRLDHIRAVWHQQLEHPASRNEVELIARLVEQFAQDMERKLFRRDVTESSLALAGVVFFGWLAVRLPMVTGKIGCLIIVAGAVVIIAKFWHTRHAGRPPAGSLPLEGYLSQERQHLVRQIRLLRSVAWWYLSPTLLGANLIFWAISPSWIFSACYSVVSVMVGVFIWWLNQQAIRSELQPMLDEIDRVTRQLSFDAQTDRGTS
jgi:hypothetical protein